MKGKKIRKENPNKPSPKLGLLARAPITNPDWRIVLGKHRSGD
jgi:hypothetical protein